VNRHARVYQGGTQQRSEYGGKFRRAVELIRNGRIGRVTEVYACRPGGAFHADGGVTLAPQPVPKDLDWDLFLGPAPWRPFGGHSGAHMFGDGGINWGQHHYDIVQWALDADRTGPVEIGHEDGHTVYRYDGGVTVHGCPCPGETVGMSGGACFIGTEGRIAVDRENLVAEPAERLDEPLGPEATRLPRLDGHSANFLDCIRTRKKTIVDAETAHRAVSVVLLGGLAQQLGRRLQWNPAKESFIDDPQANRLRSYAPREPWRT
jgi:predicted dehydrogenase